MEEQELVSARIRELVRRERLLRERLSSGQIDADEGRDRLRQTEELLDQCWELVRQRSAGAAAARRDRSMAVSERYRRRCG